MLHEASKNGTATTALNVLPSTNNTITAARSTSPEISGNMR